MTLTSHAPEQIGQYVAKLLVLVEISSDFSQPGRTSGGRSVVSRQHFVIGTTVALIVSDPQHHAELNAHAPEFHPKAMVEAWEPEQWYAATPAPTQAFAQPEAAVALVDVPSEVALRRQEGDAAAAVDVHDLASAAAAGRAMRDANASDLVLGEREKRIDVRDGAAGSRRQFEAKYGCEVSEPWWEASAKVVESAEVDVREHGRPTDDGGDLQGEVVMLEATLDELAAAAAAGDGAAVVQWERLQLKRLLLLLYDEQQRMVLDYRRMDAYCKVARAGGGGARRRSTTPPNGSSRSGKRL